MGEAHRRRQGPHHALDARDGPGRDDRHAHAARRGARHRLGQHHHRVGAGRRALRQPELRRPAADGRQQQHARHVEAAARGRVHGARDARLRRRQGLGRGRQHVLHAEGRRGARRQRSPRHLRVAGGQGGRAAGAEERPAQGSEGVHAARHRRPAARHPGQGERVGRVRRRRQAPRTAGGARGALPRVRRQGGQLQCRQGEGRARREARGADQHRRRGGGRRLLGGLAGRQGAAGHLERGPAGQPELGGDHQTLRATWRRSRA